MFRKSIIEQKESMYDGLPYTVYNNIDSRCIIDSNPINNYDLQQTVPIFSDYKNNLGYQGEAILLEKIPNNSEQTFISDLDLLYSKNDKSLLPLINQYEFHNKSQGLVMIELIKQLHEKSSYYYKVSDESNTEFYSKNVSNILNNLRNYYKKISKLSKYKTQHTLYKALLFKLNALKKKELRTQITKYNPISAFFKELTPMQIIYNVIKTVTVNISPPLYYLEMWRVMFIPQYHYTVPCYENQLNISTASRSEYNANHTKMILYNTPFVTNRYIRHLADTPIINE